MANLSDLTRKQQILAYLQDHKSEWVDGTKLATEEVGGSEGLRRLRDLRGDGYFIEQRRHPSPDRDIWQYRLRNTDACENWTGALSSTGYGSVFADGRYWTAHNRAWVVANGPVPDGMVVMHTCDNRQCIKLSHLKIGTRAENSADMVAKGRSAKGSKNGQAKLTDEQVEEIRKLESTMSQRDLADLYGVSQSNVSMIINKVTWPEVSPLRDNTRKDSPHQQSKLVFGINAICSFCNGTGKRHNVTCEACGGKGWT